MSTLYPWMVWKDDTNTERRSGRWDVYSVYVNDLKRRYEHRETKRKTRCLLCIREWSEKTIRIRRDVVDTRIYIWFGQWVVCFIWVVLFELFCLGCFVWVALSELSFVWVVLFLSCVLFELCLVWRRLACSSEDIVSFCIFLYLFVLFFLSAFLLSCHMLVL